MISKSRRREIKFWFILHVLLPVLAIVLRMIVYSWRIDRELRRQLTESLQSHDRLVFAIGHGNIATILPLVAVCRGNGRRSVGLTSPSRDGRVIAQVLGYVGIAAVAGSSTSGGSSGLRGMVREVRARSIGVITVDGPRGPCLVPKPGIVSVARLADAQLMVMALDATSGLRLGTWDRFLFPWPFARIRGHIVNIPSRAVEGESEEAATARLEAALRDAHRTLGTTWAEEGTASP